MRKKGSKIDTTNLTPTQLRDIADRIERYSELYRIAADEMDRAGLKVLPVSGMTALENNGLRVIRGNASTVQAIAQKHADAAFMASIAEDPANYVIDDSDKKKAAKGKKKS